MFLFIINCLYMIVYNHAIVRSYLSTSFVEFWIGLCSRIALVVFPFGWETQFDESRHWQQSWYHLSFIQRGHIHKPYRSHINPHKLVNKTPVSCPCGVPESLRPSSIESNRVYTCIHVYSKHVTCWMVQTAGCAWRSILSLNWSYSSLSLSHSTASNIFQSSWHVRRLRRSRSHRLQREDMKQKAGSQSPDAVRGFRMIPRQQVQTCDLLWFMADNDGEWWTMMDDDVDCV